MGAASHCEWSMSAEPVAVPELRAEVSAFAARVGVGGSALDDIRICVAEAVTNAVIHAFRDRRFAGIVTVRVVIHTDELIVIVSDDGIGFAPRTGSRGLGLGIPTIAAMTTSMSIAASADGGTEICMAFAR